MSLRIHSAEFITSAPSLKQCPEWELPEIALIGRSNVGKSSFINTLLNRKNLAKTSNTPGKTRLINFYKINDAFSFVDLPGYGYAKVSKTMQAEWQKHLSTYLQKRDNLVLTVQLIDSRHGPQPSDIEMLEWLSDNELPILLVLTKVDKLSRNDLRKYHAKAAKQLDLQPDEIIMFSAQTGWGKDIALASISSVLKA